MNAAARYRDIGVTARVLGAAGPALTAILYEELADTLRTAQRPSRLGDAGARAVTMLAELDAGLSADPADAFAHAMRAIHRQTGRFVARALKENDPKWSQAALETIVPIVEAWSSLRSSA